MDFYTLPPTAYQAPSWQVQNVALNTIIEDDVQESIHELRRRARTSGRMSVDGASATKDVGVGVKQRNGKAKLSSPPHGQLYTTNKGKQSPVFNELYDITDDEKEVSASRSPSPRFRERPLSESTFSTQRSSTSSMTSSVGHRNRYPSLTIPSPNKWPSSYAMHKLSSPVPPTPPPKIPVSPAILSLLNKDVPAANAPPSLDGSLTSDQVTNCSAPDTPDMQLGGNGTAQWSHNPNHGGDPGSVDHITSAITPATPEIVYPVDGHSRPHSEFVFPEHGELPLSPHPPEAQIIDASLMQNGGVLLPPAALETLQHLTLDQTSPGLGSKSASTDQSTQEEMQELPFSRRRPASVGNVTPASMPSNGSSSLAPISIPSPGGFFASLSKGARYTWSFPSSNNPPSSATAERFYSAPWNTSPSRPVERIVEVSENETEGPPTARQASLFRASAQDDGDVDEIKTTELVIEYDEDYDRELRQLGSANLDRTGTWLAQQEAYLAALKETNPVNDPEPATPVSAESKRSSKHVRDDSLDSPMKKAVRFLESEAAAVPEETRAPEAQKKEPIFLRGFQHISESTKKRDAFVHAQARYDAVQASRVCLGNTHLDQLHGRYEISNPDRPSPPRPISLMPGTKKEEQELTPEQKVFARVEKERQTLEQICVSMWIVQAMKYYHSGKLVISPATKRLANAGTLFPPIPNAPMKRTRALDLGGQAACDWGWFCAHAYRNVKVYTVVTKQQVINSDIKGPHNHRHVSVSHFWKLPFPDCHFDVISARTLHMNLKSQRPDGENVLDEYDLCLQECFRVLKPGGYLEYFVQDAEIIRAGSLGLAASVEFAFNLKTMGYDHSPTKSWISRLRKSGFSNVKRAWLFLPVGAPATVTPSPLRETPEPEPRSVRSSVEAVQGPVGSTAAAATVVGLVGGWMWEQWMLKLHMEIGKEEGHLLEHMGALVEEGRNCGAGWRCLEGWARKPRGKKK
ncbi:MAG: hypothetical protein M1834_005129 [Cirrosporium novae-zelandiae]|nr:MAG: hypothetical protein M1834_005129 [Cirrosporium novae-zelandiae]